MKNHITFEKSSIANLPSKYGHFKIRAYKEGCQEHLAIFTENFNTVEAPLVRIHSQCLTGDTFGSIKCDCNNQLHKALKLIADQGGLIIYHAQEGRNIGLLNKLNAYALQDLGRNTIEANVELGFAPDQRTYDVVREVFNDFGLKKIRLLTNNPAKVLVVEDLDVEIVERIPVVIDPNPYNEGYLRTKKECMGHII
ncbi:MAG: GTP cyclohydrolase II [Sulfuricurvum sp.]|uniref:GTP cyclohydrolase II n=1 Tax=Sulfuricurvum sp. TaxID=2025608 RepID=UPI002622EF2E|nr:GTP cyclohydrolase II [Sulfuricurvum sp.]MDD2828589.1 GTP cyclohydrolase II [Sulfuricurvum sp.]MDD4948266.1 GTP cyclohydrolase II [Sulfuricurvum sp.]